MGEPTVLVRGMEEMRRMREDATKTRRGYRDATTEIQESKSIEIVKKRYPHAGEASEANVDERKRKKKRHSIIT